MKIEINNNAIDGILNGFLDLCGEQLVREAKSWVPVDTGKLQNSIEVKNKDYANKSVHVGSSLPYALPIELGHTNKNGNTIQPQPFLRIALDLLPTNLRM